MGKNKLPPKLDIIEVLNSLENGDILVEAEKLLRDVVKAALDTSKKGSITLKIEVVGGGNKVLYTPSLTAKIPEPTRVPSIAYANEEGDLFTAPPNQTELPLSDVQVGENGLRVIDDDDD